MLYVCQLSCDHCWISDEIRTSSVYWGDRSLHYSGLCHNQDSLPYNTHHRLHPHPHSSLCNLHYNASMHLPELATRISVWMAVVCYRCSHHSCIHSRGDRISHCRITAVRTFGGRVCPVVCNRMCGVGLGDVWCVLCDYCEALWCEGSPSCGDDYGVKLSSSSSQHHISRLITTTVTHGHSTHMFTALHCTGPFVYINTHILPRNVQDVTRHT